MSDAAIVENSTADQPTIIEGTRTGTTTEAFIQLRSEFCHRLGSTQTKVSQHGPMFTGGEFNDRDSRPRENEQSA